jgi:hypothetical protein
MYSRKAWIGRVAFVSEEVNWRRLRDSRLRQGSPIIERGTRMSMPDVVLIRGKREDALAASTFRLSPLRGCIERAAGNGCRQ